MKAITPPSRSIAQLLRTSPRGHYRASQDPSVLSPSVAALNIVLDVTHRSKCTKFSITTSSVIFNNFKYKSDFQVFPNDVVQFTEIFKDTTSPDSKKTRQNVHKMWMPSKQTVINQCKEVGFINYAQADLLMAQMEYQYLYMFQKPE